MKLINSIMDYNLLKFNANIAIYGAGYGARHLIKLIKLFRKDLIIQVIIDDYKKGFLYDKKIVNLDKFKYEYLSVDCIIISSKYYEKIYKKLDFFSKKILIANPILFSSRLFSKDEILEIYNQNEDIFCQKEYIEMFHMDKNFFYNCKDKFDKAIDVFVYEEDRELYKYLLEERLEHKGDFTKKLIEKFNYIYTPYLDFVNLANAKNIIEGGVSTGYITLQFLGAAHPNVKIFGFEPFIEYLQNGEYFNILKQYKNVKFFNFGLWSCSKELSFYFNEKNPAASKILKDKYTNNKIKVVSLDEFIKEHNLESLDFLKLDVEGSEFEIIKGAIKSIKKNRTQLAISIYHSSEDFFQIPLYLKEKLSDYIFRIGHYSGNLSETVLYGIPKEKYRKVLNENFINCYYNI